MLSWAIGEKKNIDFIGEITNVKNCRQNLIVHILIKLNILAH